jgi:undecaprenol kinase
MLKIQPSKNHSQMARFGFALAGLRAAWQREASFRTEVIIGALVLIGLVLWRPPWFVWVGCSFSMAMVLAAELFNTAIENLCDVLHPDQHPLIKIAKDCGSAAVFMAVLNSVIFVLAVVYWVAATPPTSGGLR